MTTSEIIEDLYLSPEVDRCILKLVNKEYQEDFKQELFIIIATMKEEVIVTLHKRNQLKFYIARVILNLCRHKRKFYHKQYLDRSVTYDTDAINRMNPPSDYNQMEERIAAEDREMQLVEAVEAFDSTFNTPYFRMLVHVVNNTGSMREASRQTGIDVSVISRSMKKVREHLNKI